MDQSEFEAKIAGFLKNVPESLPLWEALRPWGARRAIAQMNYEATVAEGDEQSALVSALPWMVYWAMKYVSDSNGGIMFPTANDTWPDMDDAWTVAKKHNQVRSLLQGVISGLLEYEYVNGQVRLPYNGHPELDLLDKSLRYMEVTAFPRPIMLELGQWLVETEGRKSWFNTPRQVQQQVRGAALSLAGNAPAYLPLETATPINGVNLRALGKYWTELMAISLYDFYAMQRARRPTQMVYVRKKFVRHMSRVAEISQEAAGKITASLTITKSDASDPQWHSANIPGLTPLVEVNGGLFLVSSVIVVSMPSWHNMKLLQVVHRESFGEMGDLLGKVGEYTIADHLGKVLKDAPYVKARIGLDMGTKGQGDPDLDVVVYSPGQLLVVIEVKWHIPVGSTFEALQKEGDARRGRLKLAGWREKISREEVSVKWPGSWPDPERIDEDPCERRWFVVTHDTTPAHNLGDSDIKMRSYLLLKHLLKPGSSVCQLISLLDNPPVPNVGESCWETVQYGDVTMKWEDPEPHSDQPEPFKNLQPENLRRRK